jgi:vacuolar iron transporter family protein
MRLPHPELHRTDRIGWLRAAVLGANDGIVSTASLVVGVAAANTSSNAILVAGVAGLVAGAMSMAAGEYVSVSSQADTEKADLERERAELSADPQHEHAELTAIYEKRGLDHQLASQVAEKLMKHWEHTLAMNSVFRKRSALARSKQPSRLRERLPWVRRCRC